MVPLVLESIVLAPYQFAYKSKHSPLSVVSCLTHAINAHLDKGCKVFKTMVLGFNKALSRQRLLDKLATTNPSVLVKWVQSYFIGHSQCIRSSNKGQARELRGDAALDQSRTVIVTSG